MAQFRVLFGFFLRLMFRSKAVLISSGLFSVFILLIFRFGFEEYSVLSKVSASVIWSALIFSCTILISEMSSRFQKNSFVQGVMMTGVSNQLVYLAQLLTIFIASFMQGLLILILFVLFFNHPLDYRILFMVIFLVLGLAGYASVHILFSTMASVTSHRYLMVGILVFPIAIPLLMICVKNSSQLLMQENPQNLGFLIGYDMIAIAASSYLYDFAIEVDQ